MSAYADASAAVNGSEAGGYGLCCANGCSLPGTMSTSTQGPKQWHCRLHFGAPRGDWDSITAHIANRRRLFEIAYRLVNDQAGGRPGRKVRDELRALGRPEFPQLGDITSYAMGSEMLQVLGRECRAPQQHMGTPKSAGPTWLDATQPEDRDA